MDILRILLDGVYFLLVFVFSIELLIDSWKIMVRKEKILITPSRMNYWAIKLFRGKESAESYKQSLLLWSPTYAKLEGIFSFLGGIVTFIWCMTLLVIVVAKLFQGQ
jgi:hypothetical protein